MILKSEVLENAHVRLEPVAERHRDAFRAACEADTEVWLKLYPISWVGEHFEPNWAKLMSDMASGAAISFAVIVDGVCKGLTSFYNIEAVNAVVEIGGTYYAPEVRGGAVNPSCKRLLMAHAFEAGARRVVYRVDALNTRSRAAVTKLGAVEEALLRQDRLTWTGRIRDTVIFSILANEWPGVRDRLDARLAQFA